MLKNLLLPLLFLSLFCFCNGENTEGQTVPSPAPVAADLKLPDLNLESLNEHITKISDEKNIAFIQQTISELQNLKELENQINSSLQFLAEWPSKMENLRNRLAENSQPSANPSSPYAEHDSNIVEQLLLQEEAEINTLKEGYKKLESEQALLTERRLQIPDLLATVKQKSNEISNQVTKENPYEQLLIKAREKSLQTEISSLNEENNTHDKRLELLRLQMELNLQKQQKISRNITELNKELHRKRQLEAELAIKKALEAKIKAAELHPVVQEIAEENAAIASLRTGESGLTAKLEYVLNRSGEIETTNDNLQNDRRILQQKVDAVGMTDVIGLLFRKQRTQIPDTLNLERRTGRHRREIANTQLKIIETEEKLQKLRNIPALLQNITKKINKTEDEQQKELIINSARELLNTQKKLLESLHRDYNNYFIRLVDLNAAELLLIKNANNFADYIDEHILWIRSTNPWSIKNIANILKGFDWYLSPDNWKETFLVLQQSIAQNVIAVLIFCLLLAALLISSRKLNNWLNFVDESRRSETSFKAVIETILIIILNSVFWPSILYALALLIQTHPEVTDFSRSLSPALRHAAAYIFIFFFLKTLMRPKGLAETCFLWKPTACRMARKNMYWLWLLMVPCASLFVTLPWHPQEHFQDSTERLLLLIYLLSMACYIRIVFNPANEWMLEIFRKSPKSWLKRSAHIWAPFLTALPIILGLLSIIGFHYTSMQMVIKLHSTFLWLFSLLLLKSLGLHLLFLLRRELALHRIQEKRRERAEKIAAEEITDSEIPMPSAAEDEATDISQLNQQTRKLLDSSITILFLFGLWLIWSGMLPALGVFSRIELWHDIQPVTEQTLSLNPSSANNPAQTAPLINTQMTAITLADLLLSIIMFFITWIAVNNLPGLLEISILQRLSLPNAQCYAIVTLFRYAIIFTGIALALNIIGIGWSKIQWLAAAFTVGLGFGLQEIFANFAAGLIILFEQPVRKGDIITINDISGVVSKIRIRTTTITDFNRKDLIVPNKDFITTRVINWTLSDSVLRLVIPVGVAYGSDVEKVEKILLDIAEEHPKVLDNPPSFVVLQKFGESSIDFDFRIFIDDLDSYTIIWNDILVSIYKKFKDEGIQIPFPQRDLHIKESPVYYNKVLNGE